ncbi:peptidylprolyl isomerase [Prevotella histicola]|uniref:peptidylprolyl isomerase n=1 Tax=Prevotella histicola TaxID=470565 RepID=UPI001CB0052E|nr:peptidylprolyl isomerase [Prevotella histicola]MBF1417272.1 peptidylprolyl isomerase [Prevotella histicola]
MRKKIFTLLAIFLAFTAVTMQAQTVQDAPRHEVLLETDSGDIRIELFNETPKHRDNFLRLVRSGAYDGVLFHRVIKDFMIQTGDVGSKNAKPGETVGDTPETYTVPAEICFPKLFHHRGAVGAAREGDDVNPKRESSATQFYIVWGYKFTDGQLDKVQQRLNERTDSTVQLTPEVREAYKTVGGAPHLDGQYTVFGQVIQGLDIVDLIQCQPGDKNDRPLNDTRIRRALIVK